MCVAIYILFRVLNSMNFIWLFIFYPIYFTQKNIHDLFDD